MRDMTGADLFGTGSSMKLYYQPMAWLKQAAQKKGNMNRLAEELGVEPNLFSRWFSDESDKGHRDPSWRKLSEILEKLGVAMCFPGECKKANAPAIPEELTHVFAVIEAVMKTGADKETVEAAAQAALKSAIGSLMNSSPGYRAAQKEAV